MYFIWKGTESIKFLEEYSAPILILMGVLLIAWGAMNGGGFSKVLQQSKQLAQPSATIQTDKNQNKRLILNPLQDASGLVKAKEYRLTHNGAPSEWLPIESLAIAVQSDDVTIELKSKDGVSSSFSPGVKKTNQNFTGKLWSYILWLTIMVGFWATMSLSIADITRFAATQKDQVMGQFIGLPGTMMLYSFVGIFVTCAAVINFDDILISNDAPWDPVSLLAKFSNPVVVVVSQIFMIIATLSTNIAANVIAPANAFSNISPRNISFQKGGIIAAIIGIITCPWWLMDEISGLLIFVSSFLGPILAILIGDYFFIRKKEISTEDLFLTDGKYTYQNGYNVKAFIALTAGVATALVGLFVPTLEVLYNSSWFSSFAVSLVVYYLLSYRNK